MSYLIKNVQLLDPHAPFHEENVDVLIRDGIVVDVAKKLDVPEAKIITGKSLHLSVGWMDVGAQSCDPGFEWREDLYSLAKAALAGGYTDVAVLPNTQPCIHSKAELLYLQDKAKDCIVDIWPLAAISKECKGKDITEFMDMHRAGALAFTDGFHSIQHSGLMRLALLYVKAFDGLVMNRPLDEQLAPNGQIHESALSASLGMPGIPPLAEELMVQRDLYLAEYTGSRLHLSDLSTAGSVDLLRRAKARGLRVTASVMAPHLCFTEEAIRDFNPFYKLSPPLRTEDDRKALCKGVEDGTIDFISSGHRPLEEEAQNRPFFEAAYGMSSLETTFAMLNTFSGLSLAAITRSLAQGPREVLRLPLPHLAKAQPATLTLFDATATWVPGQDMPWRSKSRNNPFLGKKPLKGKILALWKAGTAYFL